MRLWILSDSKTVTLSNNAVNDIDVAQDNLVRLCTSWMSECVRDRHSSTKGRREIVWKSQRSTVKTASKTIITLTRTAFFVAFKAGFPSSKALLDIVNRFNMKNNKKSQPQVAETRPQNNNHRILRTNRRCIIKNSIAGWDQGQTREQTAVLKFENCNVKIYNR